jgi:hypothetical protein
MIKPHIIGRVLLAALFVISVYLLGYGLTEASMQAAFTGAALLPIATVLYVVYEAQ